MNNSDLDYILKRARRPEPPAEYWDRFSGRVLANPAFRRSVAGPGHSNERSSSVDANSGSKLPHTWTKAPATQSAGSFWTAFRVPNFAMGFGLATAAVLLVVFLGARLFERGSTESLRSQRALAEKQFAGAKKYYEEIAPLFPERLSAIIFDNLGDHLQLSETPSAPGSVPLYLKICGPLGCQRVVTFSGRQIRINGALCDVLLGHAGEIIVTGPAFWWSSAAGSNPQERYKIEARPLETIG